MHEASVMHMDYVLSMHEYLHHLYLSSAISFIDELPSDHFSLGGYETDPTICDNIPELPSHQSK